MQTRFGNANYSVDPAWVLGHVAPPSRLFGANGIRTGSDGLIYVAQLTGSRISTIDPDSGEVTHLETSGAEIVGPDDLVFDDAGNLYVTEFTENRVSMRAPNGVVRVLQGELFGSNPITFHQGRLIAGECRMDARIMELDRNGGAPRVIVDGLAMTNAFDVGPDGMLYFPVMEANQIWRVSLDGGEPEVIVGDLGVPDSVKFDAEGNIISTQVGSGLVLRIDPRSGAREVLADIGPGLDNSTFVGDHLFVSHMTGSIHEIVRPGEVRILNPKGFLWPMGVAAASDGAVYVADGSYAYVRKPGGTLDLVGMLFTPGFPGFHRGVAAGAPGEWFVTTSIGEVKRYRPQAGQSELLASGYDRLMGLAVAPGGAIVFVESGTGRVLSLENGEATVLAAALDNPTGIAIAADGTCFVSESGSGRVVRLEGGRSETVLDGLQLPEGLCAHEDRLYVIDVTARTLVEFGSSGGDRKVIMSGLPVGAPEGPRKYLGPAGAFSGPMLSFAGLAAGSDGTLFIGADGEGSVLSLKRQFEAQWEH